jgi:hypothetical protein
MIVLVFPDVAVEVNLGRISFSVVDLFETAALSNDRSAYVNDDIVSWELPRIKIQPVIWYFYLISVHNFLLEDAITIPETITPSGIIYRCETVKEASCKTTEPPISERSVMLLFNDILDTEAEVEHAL